MSREALVLDVRDDIRRGREPFSKVMQAVASLAPGQDLILIAPFEPTPLYRVLGQQGLQPTAESTPEGDFKVRFSRSNVEGARGACGDQLSASSNRVIDRVPVVDVDARGLEPPQPMVKILEAVASLPAGGEIRAHTDRRPMHLYAKLEERGFAGESLEQADGSFVTVIRPSTKSN